MQLKFGDIDVYHKKTLMRKLKEHFGKRLIITDQGNQSSLLTLHENIADILREHRSMKDFTEESIITAAGRIIRSQTRSKEQTKEYFPACGTLPQNQNYLVPALRQLLNVMITSKRADLLIASLGHAIMGAISPVSLTPPILQSVGIYVQHKHASRLLNDLLYQLGFSCSYNHGTNWRRSAAKALSELDLDVRIEALLHLIADNFDHNVMTIDGFGTKHVLGVMAGVTPGTVRLTLSCIACIAYFVYIPKIDHGHKIIHDFLL